MTADSIFTFSDYKAYLLSKEVEFSQIQKGFKSKLALAAICQNAFISQIFHGTAHFSMEQALRISSFLQHSEIEKSFFLNLLQLARAGTPELKLHFERILDQSRDQQSQIKNRVTRPDRILTDEVRAIYYSQWYFSAIHMLTTIPKFQTIDAMVRALGLHRRTVQDAVSFLVRQGLLEEKSSGKFTTGFTQIHLEKSFPETSKHQTDLHIKAIESIREPDAKDFHYGTTSTLSQADVEKLREAMLEFVQKYTALIKPSKEETMYCFNLDFFCAIRS